MNQNLTMDNETNNGSETNTVVTREEFYSHLEHFLRHSFNPNINGREIEELKTRIRLKFGDKSFSFTEVNLSNKSLTNPNRVELLVEMILQNKSITKINFSNNELAGTTVFTFIARLIDELPDLKMLDLSNTMITEEGIQLLVDTINGTDSESISQNRKGNKKKQTSTKRKKGKEKEEGEGEKNTKNISKTSQKQRTVKTNPKSQNEENDVSMVLDSPQEKERSVFSEVKEKVNNSKIDNNLKVLSINNCMFLATLPSNIVQRSDSESFIGNGWQLLHGNIGEVFLSTNFFNEEEYDDDAEDDESG